MNQNSSYFLFLLLCFSVNTFLNAQPQNDSLAKYSYEELHALIDSTKYDKQELSKIYTSAYLKRAKLDNDKVKISRGYFYLMTYYYDKNISNGLKYADSIIEICKKCKHKKYPALGYYFKGYFYSLDGKTQDSSLDNFLKTLQVLSENNNIELEIITRTSIISLQSNWSANEETLDFAKENLEFIIDNKEKIDGYRDSYFIALDNLSIEYLRNKKYRKGLEIVRKGIEESIIFENISYYYNFVSLAGIAEYSLKNYQAAIDSLQKALPHKTDHGKAMNNFYLGKSYDKLKQPEKAQFHFLKTDSIYQATKDIFPEMRNTYEHIIDYYKSKNDVENQIKYYDRLIETDKIIDSTYTYVTNTIEKKFDTPQAIAERARLVEEAKSSENSWKYSFGIISAVLLAISGVLFYVYRRQKYYKQRFENLMTKSSSKEKSISTALDVTQEKDTSIHSNESAKTLEAQKQKVQDIGISEIIVKSILKGLAKFEASEGYRKQVTLTELAKNLETNPKYLSKVINWHYKKNFTSYINELRVQDAISKLKEEAVFRNYTIKAIAIEVGFKNAESFSKTFYKVTGIYPSYFIKQLNKRSTLD